jgi:hypothetical protein
MVWAHRSALARTSNGQHETRSGVGGAGGEQDNGSIRQCLELTCDAEPGEIGGCQVDDCHVGPEGGRRNHRVCGPHIGDIDSFGA